MTRLRVGIVGAGHLGRIHTRLLKSIDEVEVVGVADPIATARQNIEQEFGVRTCSDFVSLIDQVDALVVAAPTSQHFDIARAMLLRGKHLLVEKPLTADATQADELVTLARQHGAILQVGHVERFNPAWFVSRPYLDDVRHIETVRASGFTGRSTDIGVVHDLMIHDLDLVLHLVDSHVDQVEAFGMALLGPHEDVAEARLTFENGCTATLKASRVSPTAARQWQAVTPHHMVHLDFGGSAVQVITPCDEISSHRFQFDRLSGEDRSQIKDQLFQRWMPIQNLEVPSINAILEEQRDFIHAVRTGKQPQVTGAQAAETLHVAEQILQEIAEHRWYGKKSKPSQIGPMAIPARETVPAIHRFEPAAPVRKAA